MIRTTSSIGPSCFIIISTLGTPHSTSQGWREEEAVKRRYRKLLDRIVDMMFPDVISGLASLNTNGRPAQVERGKKGKAATQKFLNWRAKSKLWSEPVAHFGVGDFYRYYPEDFPDEK